MSNTVNSQDLWRCRDGNQYSAEDNRKCKQPVAPPRRTDSLPRSSRPIPVKRDSPVITTTCQSDHDNIECNQLGGKKPSTEFLRDLSPTRNEYFTTMPGSGNFKPPPLSPGLKKHIEALSCSPTSFPSTCIKVPPATSPKRSTLAPVPSPSKPMPSGAKPKLPRQPSKPQQISRTYDGVKNTECTRGVASTERPTPSGGMTQITRQSSKPSPISRTYGGVENIDCNRGVVCSEKIPHVPIPRGCSFADLSRLSRCAKLSRSKSSLSDYFRTSGSRLRQKRHGPTTAKETCGALARMAEGSTSKTLVRTRSLPDSILRHVVSAHGLHHGKPSTNCPPPGVNMTRPSPVAKKPVPRKPPGVVATGGRKFDKLSKLLSDISSCAAVRYHSQEEKQLVASRMPSDAVDNALYNRCVYGCKDAPAFPDGVSASQGPGVVRPAMVMTSRGLSGRSYSEEDVPQGQLLLGPVIPGQAQPDALCSPKHSRQGSSASSCVQDGASSPISTPGNTVSPCRPTSSQRRGAHAPVHFEGGVAGSQYSTYSVGNRQGGGGGGADTGVSIVSDLDYNCLSRHRRQKLQQDHVALGNERGPFYIKKRVSSPELQLPQLPRSPEMQADTMSLTEFTVRPPDRLPTSLPGKPPVSVPNRFGRPPPSPKPKVRRGTSVDEAITLPPPAVASGQRHLLPSNLQKLHAKHGRVDNEDYDVTALPIPAYEVSTLTATPPAQSSEDSEQFYQPIVPFSDASRHSVDGKAPLKRYNVVEQSWQRLVSRIQRQAADIDTSQGPKARFGSVGTREDCGTQSPLSGDQNNRPEPRPRIQRRCVAQPSADPTLPRPLANLPAADKTPAGKHLSSVARIDSFGRNRHRRAYSSENVQVNTTCKPSATETAPPVPPPNPPPKRSNSMPTDRPLLGEAFRSALMMKLEECHTNNPPQPKQLSSQCAIGSSSNTSTTSSTSARTFAKSSSKLDSEPAVTAALFEEEDMFGTFTERWDSVKSSAHQSASCEAKRQMARAGTTSSPLADGAYMDHPPEPLPTARRPVKRPVLPQRSCSFTGPVSRNLPEPPTGAGRMPASTASSMRPPSKRMSSPGDISVETRPRVPTRTRPESKPSLPQRSCSFNAPDSRRDLPAPLPRPDMHSASRSSHVIPPSNFGQLVGAETPRPPPTGSRPAQRPSLPQRSGSFNAPGSCGNPPKPLLPKRPPAIPARVSCEAILMQQTPAGMETRPSQLRQVYSEYRTQNPRPTGDCRQSNY